MTLAAIEAVGAVGAEAARPVAMQIGLPATLPTAPASGAGFNEVLMSGLRNVDAKIADADSLVRQFAVDDSVPVHQVTMALAEARMSLDLAMQVRTRLVESYREIMNMQL